MEIASIHRGTTSNELVARSTLRVRTVSLVASSSRRARSGQEPLRGALATSSLALTYGQPMKLLPARSA
jgi:hypothetical protein